MTREFGSFWGSSPLSRGIPRLLPLLRRPSRIIPALAGNTTLFWMKSSCGRDHPRSRGEYKIAEQPARMFRGSSPLSRGIPGPPLGRLAGWGIIPALAGNTPTRSTASSAARDHPRSRGEYYNSHVDAVDEQRIIPALAGNTNHGRCGGCASWDHPRSRGEYEWGAHRFWTVWGSSPLSRGIVRVWYYVRH